MSFGSSITSLGTAAAVGASLYDKKNKTVNKDGVKSLISTSVALSATVVAGESLSHRNMTQIREKYASAYVQSMSDEELEQALIQMDLLAPETENKTEEKTI